MEKNLKLNRKEIEQSTRDELVQYVTRLQDQARFALLQIGYLHDQIQEAHKTIEELKELQAIVKYENEKNPEKSTVTDEYVNTNKTLPHKMGLLLNLTLSREQINKLTLNELKEHVLNLQNKESKFLNTVQELRYSTLKEIEQVIIDLQQSLCKLKSANKRISPDLADEIDRLTQSLRYVCWA